MNRRKAFKRCIQAQLRDGLTRAEAWRWSVLLWRSRTAVGREFRMRDVGKEGKRRSVYGARTMPVVRLRLVT